jgi:hypothetical protein
MINTPNSKVSKQIKCSICRVDIKDRNTMYQSSLKLGVICKSCRDRFSKDDIEMIVNLFFAFGGYFGQFDKSDFSIDDLIVDFARQLDAGNSTFHLQNVKMWHKILTHGIAPKEFLKELSMFVDQGFP